MCIRDRAEGGESYYAMLDDDPIIYLIPSNEIGSLFSMTVDNLTAVEETDEETDADTKMCIRDRFMVILLPRWPCAPSPAAPPR